MLADPREALERLLDDAAGMEQTCNANGVRLLVAFGSTARAEPDPADLDLAFASQPDCRVDLMAFVRDVTHLTGTEQLDLLDLDRAGVVADWLTSLPG